MSLFVKEAQPPPGCARRKWPDSHGPQATAALARGFPSGAVPRAGLTERKCSGTRPLLAHSLRLRQVLPGRAAGCLSEPGVAHVRGKPGGTDAVTGLLPLASRRPGKGARGGELKAAPEGDERSLIFAVDMGI